jgi:2'-5' RNA ligase
MSLVPTLRCFVALPVDEDVAHQLFDAAADLDLPGMRRVSAEDMHMTLKFLGDIEHGEVSGVLGAIREATAAAAPFELEVTGLGYFPKPDRPRVLVAHTTQPEALTRFVNDLEEAMADVGFRREGRTFRPHITLGRFRKPPRGAGDVGAVDLGGPSFDVGEALLMESVRRKSGASYARMGSFEFG